MFKNRLAHIHFMILMLCTACFHEDGPPQNDFPPRVEDADPMSILSHQQDFPGNAECPHGGIILNYGADSNNNALLEENEITASETICFADTRTDSEPEENDETQIQEQEFVVCEGDFEITNTTELLALSPCHEITGNLYIRATPMTTLHGLENLQNLHALHLSANPNLHSLAALEHLENISMLHITNNPKLESLHGLENITRTTTVHIAQNALLSSLEGLESLSHAVTVHLAYNPALVSLTGLENLQQTSVFNLIHHESLSSLSKLESIQTINTRLTIINNSILPTSEAEALRDHIGAENILRGTFISGNDDLAVCE